MMLKNMAPTVLIVSIALVAGVAATSTLTEPTKQFEEARPFATISNGSGSQVTVCVSKNVDPRYLKKAMDEAIKIAKNSDSSVGNVTILEVGSAEESK